MEARTMAPEATVAFEERDAFVLVRLSGELSGTECAPVLDRIAQRARDPGGALVLDVTAVSYIGSLAIGKLVRLGQVCREGGRKMSIVAGEGKAFRAIKLLGLAAIFEHHSTVEEAALAVGGEEGGPAEGDR